MKKHKPILYLSINEHNKASKERERERVTMSHQTIILANKCSTTAFYMINLTLNIKKTKKERKHGDLLRKTTITVALT